MPRKQHQCRGDCFHIGYWPSWSLRQMSKGALIEMRLAFGGLTFRGPKVAAKEWTNKSWWRFWWQVLKQSPCHRVTSQTWGWLRNPTLLSSSHPTSRSFGIIYYDILCIEFTIRAHSKIGIPRMTCAMVKRWIIQLPIYFGMVINPFEFEICTPIVFPLWDWDGWPYYMYQVPFFHHGKYDCIISPSPN